MGENLSKMPCDQLNGVGPRMLEHLANLGIHSVQDVLFHLPIRYQDKTRLMPMNQLQPGQHALIEGEVLTAQVIFGGKRSLVVSFGDGRSVLTLRFFHFNQSMKAHLATVGNRLRCFGEVRLTRRGLEMIHPEFQVIHTGENLPLSSSLTPVYRVSEGLGQVTIRRLIKQALAFSESSLPEYLPVEILSEFKGVKLFDALRFVHGPSTSADASAIIDGRHPMVKRLAFEELLAHQLSLVKLRSSMRQNRASKFQEAGALRSKLANALGFELTDAQTRVIDEIDQDFCSGSPMLRLLQGDVGCGKTVVAAMAMCQVLSVGKQAAIMVPTEVLAEQHFQTFSKWFAPLGISVIFLVSKLSQKEKRLALESIAMGDAGIVVGTHALFQKEVHFRDLSFIVIDEQHRFGVDQRYALAQKGRGNDRFPHQLIMTATPIPRTMAMTAYADLDYSVIDALPKGRQAIQTVVLANNRRDDVISRVLANCEQGGQVYWVCTLIEESDALQCQAAEATFSLLTIHLPSLKIKLVHGRMTSEEKEEAMLDFKSGDVDLLIATTVIEVGVDVPNANLMIIENAERLGLAQLHQLRGRVGRGARASYCVLLYQSPLSSRGQARLDLLRKTQDGFLIAEKDLLWRGAGEVLGTKQTGLMRYRIADVVRDRDLLPMVQHIAKWILSKDEKIVDLLLARWIGESSANYMRCL